MRSKLTHNSTCSAISQLAKWLCYFFIFSAPFFAHAQRTELIEHKTNLETLITDRMRSTIATTVEKSAFDVSVTVSLREYKPKSDLKNPENINPASPKLEDMQMGLIDAEELIRSYQAQIEELKLKRAEYNKTKEDKPLFEVTAVNVIVGLSDKLSPEYRAEFADWLNKRIKTDFGKIGTATVSVITTTPTPLPEPKQALDYVREFQTLIGVILAILALLLSALLLRSLKVSTNEQEKQLQLSIDQKMAPPVQKLDELKEIVLKQKTSDLSLAAGMKTWQDLSTKVVALTTQSDLDINRVFDTWLDGGDFQKVACTLDVILGATQGTQAWSDIVRDLSIPEGYKVSLVETFKTMKNAEMPKKITVLEASYWDLMTFQTIGEQFLKTPFNYASAVDPKKLKDAIVVQPGNVRSLAVLAMPQSVQVNLIAQMDSVQKLEILEDSLGLNEVERTEIENVSDALKFQINNKKQKSTVSSFDLLPGLLSTFSTHEETKYLAELWKRRSGDLQKIKFIWPTLAFVDQWKSDHVQRLVSSCTTEELEGLMATLPHAQDTLLNSATPRVREILSDSMPLLAKLSPDELNKRLSGVRKKFLTQLEVNNLKLEELYQEESAISSAA